MPAVILQIKAVIEEVHTFTDEKEAKEKYRELKTKYENSFDAEVSYWKDTPDRTEKPKPKSTLHVHCPNCGNEENLEILCTGTDYSILTGEDIYHYSVVCPKCKQDSPITVSIDFKPESQDEESTEEQAKNIFKVEDMEAE